MFLASSTEHIGGGRERIGRRLERGGIGGGRAGLGLTLSHRKHSTSPVPMAEIKTVQAIQSRALAG